MLFWHQVLWTFPSNFFFFKISESKWDKQLENSKNRKQTKDSIYFLPKIVLYNSQMLPTLFLSTLVDGAFCLFFISEQSIFCLRRNDRQKEKVGSQWSSMGITSNCFIGARCPGQQLRNCFSFICGLKGHSLFYLLMAKFKEQVY